MRDTMTAALYAWGQHRNPARRTSTRVAFARGKWGMGLTMVLLISSLLIAVVPAVGQFAVDDCHAIGGVPG